MRQPRKVKILSQFPRKKRQWKKVDTIICIKLGILFMSSVEGQ